MQFLKYLLLIAFAGSALAFQIKFDRFERIPNGLDNLRIRTTPNQLPSKPYFTNRF